LDRELLSHTLPDHINYYVHPQAVIVDASSSESGLFIEAMRVQTRSMSVPLLELPENSAQQLGWMTKLDSASLAGKELLENTVRCSTH